MTLLQKHPLRICNVCRKMLRRHANPCQGKPYHNERRDTFARCKFMARIYDTHLRRSFMKCNAYRGSPCHKTRRQALACHNIMTHIYDTQCVSRNPCHKGR